MSLSLSQLRQYNCSWEFVVKQVRELIQVKNIFLCTPLPPALKQLFRGNKGERKVRKQGAAGQGWFKSALLTKAVFTSLCPVDISYLVDLDVCDIKYLLKMSQ